MQHQAQLAEKRQRQAQVATYRAQQRALAAAMRAQKQAERARADAERASEADRKEAEKEALRLYREARQAEVDAMNADLDAALAEIDAILETTLAVDDYVELSELRTVVHHPPFEPAAEIANPGIGPEPVPIPPAPVFVEPASPKGISGLLGGKRRHDEAVASARAEFDRTYAAWALDVEQRKAHEATQAQQYRDLETAREAALREARDTFAAECRQREFEAEAQNAKLDKLIAELAFDVPDAIQDYVGIVLSNSVYPESFPVEHDFTFDLSERELSLTVQIPGPDALPAIKAYKYVANRDEIVSTPLPAKDTKDRYARAVAQVAVRSLHEIFEADRSTKIRTISLTVQVTATNPGTGLPTVTPLAAVATDRETFEKIDLHNVVPVATIEHLGGVMSKNCVGLSPISASNSVRRR